MKSGGVIVTSDQVEIQQKGWTLIVICKVDVKRMYIKQLCKKFLKKKQLKDWVNVLCKKNNSLELKYYRIQNK